MEILSCSLASFFSRNSSKIIASLQTNSPQHWFILHLSLDLYDLYAIFHPKDPQGPSNGGWRNLFFGSGCFGVLLKKALFLRGFRILRAGETFASHPKNNVKSTPFGKFFRIFPPTLVSASARSVVPWWMQGTSSTGGVGKVYPLGKWMALKLSCTFFGQGL